MNLCERGSPIKNDAVRYLRKTYMVYCLRKIGSNNRPSLWTWLWLQIRKVYAFFRRIPEKSNWVTLFQKFFSRNCTIMRLKFLWNLKKCELDHLQFCRSIWPIWKRGLEHNIILSANMLAMENGDKVKINCCAWTPDRLIVSWDSKEFNTAPSRLVGTRHFKVQETFPSWRDVCCGVAIMSCMIVWGGQINLSWDRTRRKILWVRKKRGVIC